MIVITVARKPLSEPTVAANVLRHGCGAIDIDACRIATRGDEPDSGAMFYRNRGLQMPLNRQNYFHGKERTCVSTPLDGGRWPANLVLGHLPGCVCVGERQIKGSHDTTGVWGGQSARQKEGDLYSALNRDAAALRGGYTAADGTETVDAWECVLGCPVAALDAQSGIQRSGVAVGGKGNATSIFGTGMSKHEDVGGASRFFKQVKP